MTLVIINTPYLGFLIESVGESLVRPPRTAIHFYCLITFEDMAFAFLRLGYHDQREFGHFSLKTYMISDLEETLLRESLYKRPFSRQVSLADLRGKDTVRFEKVLAL